MKIAMIGQKRVPSREGGIEVAVEALAVRMAAAGHDVTLYTCRRWGIDQKRKNDKMGNVWDYCGVHIKEIPVINARGVTAVITSFFSTISALSGKYDCIHYHAEGPAAMMFIPHLFGIRTVVTIHGLDWQRSKWGRFASWYLKQGEKIAAACADEIIVLSRSAQEYFLKNYHRSTVMIPNGINRPVNRTAQKITRKWGLEKDNYILYLGRIVPEKGLELLIQAFRNVKTEKKLVIAGASSDTEAFYKRLQKLAEPDKRIVFAGFVQGEILDELYSNSYLYCLPSDLEGMPISLLEAMSYGNCCLCSDIEECASVVDTYGYLFKKGDMNDLGRSLQILCDQPDLVNKCRVDVSDYVCNQYDWNKITRKTLGLYWAEGDGELENRREMGHID